MDHVIGLAYEEDSEADYFADQTGVWEIRQDSKGVKGKVMEQVRDDSVDCSIKIF